MTDDAAAALPVGRGRGICHHVVTGMTRREREA